jgi:hypothetical protein
MNAGNAPAVTLLASYKMRRLAFCITDWTSANGI